MKMRGAAVFDLNGRRLNAQKKGLNIIRMSDGTVRKVMLK
jgi:pimeloyl-CoA synthetase